MTQKEREKKEKKIAKLKTEKSKTYAKQIREFHKPVVSEAKQKELEHLYQDLETKNKPKRKPTQPPNYLAE